MFSHEQKGVFIDLCSMYWSRLGDLPYKLAVGKICNGNATALDSLYEENVFTIIDDLICIDFLNEQLSDFENVSKTNSENARIGWEKRRNKGKVMRPQSDRNAIREEKRREEKIKEIIEFDLFWLLVTKKVDRAKCVKKWGRIKESDKKTILEVYPKYLLSQPEKQYQKNPLTWLNGECWNDEILPTKKGNRIVGLTPADFM